MESQNVNNRSNWPLIGAILEPMAEGKFDEVPDGAFSALADRLRTAIESSDPKALEDLADRTQGLVREMFKAAPAQTRQAIQDHSGDPSAVAAFLLGQTSFAQLLATRVQDRRPNAEFVAVFSDERFTTYLRALMREPMNGTALQEELGEQDATVSRKMARLRHLGVVVSRKEGTRVVNALTPAARAMAEHLQLHPLPKAAQAASRKERSLEAREDRLPGAFREFPQFSCAR